MSLRIAARFPRVAARNEAPERTMMTAAAALTSAAGAATKSAMSQAASPVRRPAGAEA